MWKQKGRGEGNQKEGKKEERIEGMGERSRAISRTPELRVRSETAIV